MPHGRPDPAGVLLALVEAEAPLWTWKPISGTERVPPSELRDQLVVPPMSLRARNPSSSVVRCGSQDRPRLLRSVESVARRSLSSCGTALPTPDAARYCPISGLV